MSPKNKYHSLYHFCQRFVSFGVYCKIPLQVFALETHPYDDSGIGFVLHAKLRDCCGCIAALHKVLYENW